MNKHYNCIDCFCGAGGLCLGLIKAGFNVLYSFDIDFKAIATMRANPVYFNSHKAEVRDIYDVAPLELLSSLGLKSGELDGIAGVGITIKDVEVAIFAREKDDGFKISFRSNNIDVSNICMLFGGGGHKLAAGCQIDSSIEEVRKAVVEETIKHLK